MARIFDRTVRSASACLVLLLLFAGVAAAASPDDLIKEGVQLRRSGHDAQAIPKFTEAYKLSGSPRSAAQLGLCLQAVSRWSEAEPLLAESLAATDDAWVKKNRTFIKESLETVKAHIGRIEVIGDPPGATVMVAGRLAGKLPLPAPVTVNEGVVDVELTAPDFKPASRTVNVTGASHQRIVMRLEPASPVSASATGAQVPTAPKAMEQPDVSAHSEVGRNVDETEPRRNTWLWVGAGAVVIAAVVVGALLIGGGDAFPDAGQVRDVE